MQSSDGCRPRVALDILLVEDNPIDVVLFKQAMRKTSIVYSLTVALDGIEALEVLKRSNEASSSLKPHVVFLDLNLPGKSGLEVLAEVKNDTQLAGLPIAVLTASDHYHDRAVCARLGVNAYFNKAVVLEDFFLLAAKIESFLLTLPQLSSRDPVPGFVAKSAA
jgi:two-component system response regulator